MYTTGQLFLINPEVANLKAKQPKMLSTERKEMLPYPRANKAGAPTLPLSSPGHCREMRWVVKWSLVIRANPEKIIEVKPEGKPRMFPLPYQSTTRPALLRSFCLFSHPQSRSQITNLKLWAKPWMPSFTSTLLRRLNEELAPFGFLVERWNWQTSVPGQYFLFFFYHQDWARGRSWSKYQLDVHITRSRETLRSCLF